MLLTLLAAVTAVLMALTAGAADAGPGETDGPSEREDVPDGVPGAGETVRVARPTWDTGWFQAEILSQLPVDPGYSIDGPRTMGNEEFYAGLADESVDVWLNGWFPLHQLLVDELAPDAAQAIGFEVRGGALQGYLVDLPTAEALGIDDLGDLAEPEIAAAFDTDGDGRAELIGCETGWACGAIVDHHLGAYGLDDTVEQVRGDYGPLMEATAARAEAGQSALFYTFTPNWTTGELVPGRGVIWLPVPFASLPADLAEQETLIEVPDIEGCPLDPCALGFAPNDIRAVASRSFLGEHPAIEALLTELTIPLEDISNQNARMMEEAVIPRPSRGCRSPSAPRTSPCSTC